MPERAVPLRKSHPTSIRRAAGKKSFPAARLFLIFRGRRSAREGRLFFQDAHADGRGAGVHPNGHPDVELPHQPAG